jgi:hypothetical protein
MFLNERVKVNPTTKKPEKRFAFKLPDHHHHPLLLITKFNHLKSLNTLLKYNLLAK